MRKVVYLVLCIVMSSAIQAQGSFIFGLKTGMSGCFYQYNSVASTGAFYGSGTFVGRLTSSGPSIPALVEFFYASKKFRIGYQFEYERILTTSYKVSGSTYSGASDTSISGADITQHFFCHNLVAEYVAYKFGKHIRLVPALSVGYFHGISGATVAPYDFSSLNQNRFKIGVAVNGEFYWGQHALVISPTYSIVPIVSWMDKNSKGFMHFVGLHIGYRFNSAKPLDAKASKKKKKEYINPEEEE